MLTIRDYFEQAQLAQAAYANFNGSLALFDALQQNDLSTFAPNFSAKQADELVL